MSERYVELKQLIIEVQRALGRQPKPPRVMPLTLARLVSFFGEGLANLTGKPPLIPKGQLIFLQWRATPLADKARAELGWKATPLAEGIRKTLEYLQAH